MSGRLAVIERIIRAAPATGITLDEITTAAGWADATSKQIAPLAWWLAHRGRVGMTRDATRWRGRPRSAYQCTADGCYWPLDPVLLEYGWTQHPACEFPPADAP